MQFSTSLTCFILNRKVGLYFVLTGFIVVLFSKDLISCYICMFEEYMRNICYICEYDCNILNIFTSFSSLFIKKMVIINKQIKPPSSSAIGLHCKSSEGNVYKMILQKSFPRIQQGSFIRTKYERYKRTMQECFMRSKQENFYENLVGKFCDY